MTALWAIIFDLLADAGFTSTVQSDVIAIHDKLIEAMSLVFGPDMQTLYGIFQAPALLMLMLYLSLDMLEKTTSENFSLDSIILDFTKLIFGVALINNGILIIQGIYGISEMACEQIIAVSGNISFTGSTTAPDTSTIWGILAFLIQTIIDVIGSVMSFSVGYLELAIISIIETVCVSIIAYQRALRIAMRLVLSPFVFADVVGNGLNTNAMHYLKVIFALCMEGPIICLCIVLVPTALMGNIGINVMFYGLVTAIVIIKLLFDSHKMAQEMFL